MILIALRRGFLDEFPEKIRCGHRPHSSQHP
jgi:hypothetical protein